MEGHPPPFPPPDQLTLLLLMLFCLSDQLYNLASILNEFKIMISEISRFTENSFRMAFFRPQSRPKTTKIGLFLEILFFCPPIQRSATITADGI